MTGDTWIFLQLLVDHLTDLGGNDLRQGGGAQLLHGVVLDRSPGKIRVRLEGKLVNGSDQRWKVFFVIGVTHHLPQLVQLGGINTSAPLKFVLKNPLCESICI